jgi:hypothetical protein
MELTILRVTDTTPDCLVTGFLLRLTCRVGDGPAFELALPLIVSREAVAQQIPLSRMALEYLKTRGLDDWPNLMLDTRHQDLSRIERTEPVFPLTVPLGGAEPVAKQVVEELAGKQEARDEREA